MMRALRLTIAAVSGAASGTSITVIEKLDVLGSTSELALEQPASSVAARTPEVMET